MRVFITFKQGKISFEKTNEQITINENSLEIPLSQEETLSLESSGTHVQIQIRAITSGGVAIVSNIMNETVEAVLKEGMIAYD